MSDPAACEKPKALKVSRPPLASLKALANPLRLRLFYAVGAHAEATATQLAGELDMPAPLVSYHLRELERFGLLELISTPERDGRERWFRIREGGVRVAEESNEAAALTHAVLRHHIRQLTRYVDHLAVAGGASDDAFTSDMVMALDPERAKTFQQEAAEMLQRYARDSPPSGSAQMLVMLQGIPFEA